MYAGVHDIWVWVPNSKRKWDFKVCYCVNHPHFSVPTEELLPSADFYPQLGHRRGVVFIFKAFFSCLSELLEVLLISLDKTSSVTWVLVCGLDRTEQTDNTFGKHERKLHTVRGAPRVKNYFSRDCGGGLSPGPQQRAAQYRGPTFGRGKLQGNDCG